MTCPQAKKEPQHQCPIESCDTMIDYGLFCCPKHWFWVPGHLKKGIIGGWRYYLQADKFPPDYRNNRQAAIDAVNAEMKERGEA